MRARAIVGKRVVAVTQAPRTDPNTGRKVFDLVSLEFEDGSRLTFTVAELASDYAVCGHVWRNGREIG